MGSTFVTLPISRTPYKFLFLSFHYLSSGRYKNEKFVENKNTLHENSLFYNVGYLIFNLNKK
jgi:hypothetical protein